MTPRATRASSLVSAASLFAVASLWSGPARADNKLACISASDQAQQLRDEGKLKLAREQMLACARDSCPHAIRKDCSAWLTALDASLPSIVLSAQDANKHDVIQVRVTVDGAPLLSSLDGRAMTIDPGPHLFRFEADGKRPVEQRVLIREGEQRRAVMIQFPPPGELEKQAGTAPGPAAPPESPKASAPFPLLSVIFGGVAVVGLGSFAIFGITGKNDLATLRDTCGVTHSCAQADVDATRGKLIIADVSLGVSIVSAGVALVFLLARGPSAKAKSASSTAATLHLDAIPLAGGAAATLGGRF